MRLLVIDDDPEIGEALNLSFAFHQRGYEVKTVNDGLTGLATFFEWRPDVVVLDIGLPEMGGLNVLKRIRECTSTPVIMLTARAGDANVAKALEMGADDYVTKPFSFLELVARIRSQVRRLDRASGTGQDSATFTSAGLTVHFNSHEVRVQNERVTLTDTEYRLLFHLVQNAGRLMSYRSLLQLVWGSETYGADVVRVYISRLRRKVELDAEHPTHIMTKPGLGYLFLAADPVVSEDASERLAQAHPAS